VNYWQRTLTSRVRRRRVLAGLGGTTAGALLLAACGGDGDGDDSETSSGGLVTTPEDTAGKGKAGGVWKHFTRADATHFDSLVSDTSQVVSISGYLAYTKLLKWKVGRHPDTADGTSEGETATSWELSPDKLTLTFKLRQNMPFDRRPPTNGRNIDSGDVAWSWRKYIANNPGARTLAYSPDNTAAPVQSIETPDANTVVFKMDHPDSSIIPLFSAADKFYIFPIEAESRFDPRSQIRGAGPWILEEHVPSVRIIWARNPDYYVKERPFPDKIEVPIVPDPTSQLSQFKNGSIYSDVHGGFGGFQLEIVPTHKDLPETLIYEAPVFPERNIWYMTFGYEGDSPFKDTRMRQAMSMLIDRDAYADVIDNRDKFAAQGLELKWEQCTILGAGWGDYWLNPRDEAKFGPNHRYLKYDAAEAKRLLSAAGFPNGADFDFHWLNDNTFGALYNSVVQLYHAMFNDGGLRGSLKGQPFNQWVDTIVQAYFYKEFTAGTKKGFNGAQLMAERPFATPANLIASTLHYLGGAFHGMSPDGKDAHKGDPKLNEMSEKLNQEFDRKRQIDQVHEVIRYVAQQAYHIPQGTSAKQFQLVWPVLSGYNAATAPPNFTNWGDALLDIWIDPSKAPIRAS
jgi:ABC-type transport system substrate-binding protein